MSTDHVTVFLDTNSLLHYPSITDVDWLKVCDAKSVTLVFCMQVIHELDEKKSDARLAPRAERVLKNLDDAQASGNKVRDNVVLEVFAKEPRADDFAEPLSPDVGDDRIIYVLKRYLEHKGVTRVVVYSEDTGMRIKCQTHKIEVLRPDRTTRLELPQTEQDKKYKAAIAELNALKNQAPEIEVHITLPDGDPANSLPLMLDLKRSFGPLDVDRAMEVERARLLEEVGKAAGASRGAPGSFTDSKGILFDGFSKQEERRYRRELDDYLNQYRTYIEEIIAQRDILARGFSFQVHVANSGTCPATGLEVNIAFPPVLRCMAIRGEYMGLHPPVPVRPEPPRPPHRGMCWPKSGDLGGFPRPELFLSRAAGIPPIRGPWSKIRGEEKTGFIAHLFVPKLKHFKTESFGKFESIFSTWETAKPFEANMTITGENLPRKVEVRVPFIVRSVT